MNIFFLIAAAAAVAAPSDLPMTSDASENLDTAFLILRKGETIGKHIVDVEKTPTGYSVATTIEMKVKFGPVPLFRYEHQSQEEWREGVLQRFVTRTNDNGKEYGVLAYREAGVLMVEGDAYKGPAPENAAPSSYWKRSLVEADAIISTQNGEIIPVETSDMGASVSPSGIPSRKFRILGTIALDLWYDGDRWVGSNFVIDGEELTYIPITTTDYETRQTGVY